MMIHYMTKGIWMGIETKIGIYIGRGLGNWMGIVV